MTAAKDGTPVLADVRAAAERIAPFVRRTPVITDEQLSELLGAEVYFKCENLQRGGAFKLRGATNAVRSLSEEEAAVGVATHSSGNHGAAVALAAKLRGIPAFVVMPENSAAVKVEAVRHHGATVIFCKPGRVAREGALERLLAEHPLHVVHPYDDYRVICGQGTAALELLEAQPKLDVLMAPIGGGGLISGCAIAAKGVNPEIEVIGAEPAQADDAYRSFHSGERVLLDSPDTIADGLRSSLGVRNFAIVRRDVDNIVRVTEGGIVQSVRLVLQRLKMLIEPSAAVAVAALLERRLVVRDRRIGIVLSGGNIDLAAASWLTEGQS